MRTTINIDDELINRAQRLTGLSEKTAIIRAGLEALIQRESAARLAVLGGTDPEAEAGRRRLLSVSEEAAGYGDKPPVA